MRSLGSVAMMAVAVAVAACSGGAGDVAPLPPESSPASSPVPPSSSATTTTSAASAPTTSAPTPTTAPGVTTPGSLTGPVFPDGLGVKVPTAPGVGTPGDTRQLLPEGLYVHIAWTADPNDPSVFTVQPDDIPILEAYAHAIATYYRAAMSTVTTDDPDFDRYYVDGGAKFDDAFARRRSAGEVIKIGTGIVLRPYLLSDQTTATTAVVLDCFLTDEAYLTGDKLKDPVALEASGQVLTMVLRDGRWLVDLAAGEPRACA